VSDECLGGKATPTLLVVDDNADVRRTLVRMLEASGGPEVEVEAVASAREARERLVQRPFSIVITDLTMPEEDGISLMQWAREHHHGNSWIVLTGHGTLDAAVQALQLGAFDFISKPLNVATLRNAVGNALDQQRLRAERDRLHAELAENNKRLCQHVEELEAACRLLEEQAETIQADLQRAAAIQRALLPQTPPNTPGLSIHALYRPSHMVGGDLYDVVRLDERRLVLLIADAAGHGLSAAMLAVLFRNRLPMVDPDTREPCRPSQVLQAANRSLLRGFTAPGLFLTAAYCLVDMTDGRVTAASAGHPPLIVQRKSGEFERLFHTGPALGLYPEAQFADKEIVLEAGDHLVLHTDGLYSRLPPNGGSPSDRVIHILQKSTPNGVESDAERLMHLAGLDPSGRDELAPVDDVTILQLGVTPAPSIIDNGARLPIPIPTATATDDDVEILVGEDPQRTTLSIRGRAGWSRSAAFHQACSAAIDLQRRVTLDLTLCEHLDSTFLGTLHELADRAEEARVELRVQGVTPQVEELFAELGMKRVLDRIVPVMLPLPTAMSALPGTDEDSHARRLRILKAHETLAALNEANRREFDPLLEVLHREVESS
jgi:sigma-B regulation protein RsbU (phosphoserine phosphatase)